ncbi:hypothetical protein DFH09DRAFT_1179174 [Mycena vulgaris]|nr:hypothetical protein DFH09DRAFT_1179174 [Mycena vulgaris]
MGIFLLFLLPSPGIKAGSLCSRPSAGLTHSKTSYLCWTQAIHEPKFHKHSIMIYTSSAIVLASAALNSGSAAAAVFSPSSSWGVRCALARWCQILTKSGV